MIIGSVADLLNFFRSDVFRQFQELTLNPEVAAPQHAGSYGIWFRGQHDESFTLVPSVFRGGQLIDEGAMNWHFMLRAANHRLECKTAFDWLGLMRHYGLPSRLLDWTENPLVALFFACHRSNLDNGSLFFLNSRRLNQAVRGKIEGWAAICVPTALGVVVRAELPDSSTLEDFVQKLRSLPLGSSHDAERLAEMTRNLEQSEQDALNYVAMPVAVFPYRSDTRLIVQQSVFTLHGGKAPLRGGLPRGRRALPEPIHLETLDGSLNQPDKFLLRLTVTNKALIMQELQQLGISSATLFPDLDHEAEWLKSLWVSAST